MKAKTHTLTEWEYHSAISYLSPFNEIELDIHLVTPSKETLIIPAFWAGAQIWKVRFIPTELGTYEILSVCTDSDNPGLHNIKQSITVIEESNNTYATPLTLSENRHYLLQNNRAFFWLSDTWWMALSSRLTHTDFTHLLTRRKAQGFNVIQLVAGLFPDMGDFDPRAQNEGGLPWQHDENMHYTTINPAYFDAADVRIAQLIEEGFTPCIVGSWGYYLLHMGERKMQQHWRYIIARWGTYPIVWCIAGEATMPYYLSTQKTKDTQSLLKGWTKLAAYIKGIEPFGRLLTIHPTEIARAQLLKPELIDINLLQASHHGYPSISRAVKLISEESKQTPTLPTLMSEVNYEGILQDTHEAVQRLTFWTSILSGSKGYGYGANGIWQVNTSQQPFGASPHGATWGNTPWDEALQLRGAQHISLAKQLLESLEWHNIKAQQTYLSPSSDLYEPRTPRMAGVEYRLRIVYFYGGLAPWDRRYTITNLLPNLSYQGYFWNPKTGTKEPINNIEVRSNGHFTIPILPTLEDWVLVVEASKEAQVKLTPHTKPLIKKIIGWFQRLFHRV